ncbi:MAG: hypothetical protein KAI24_26775, partial [Planctomycetes bacterium]|nr:hypothetical protein [Planctomycetota bacterium]
LLTAPALAQGDDVAPLPFAILPVQHLTGPHQPTPRLPFHTLVGLDKVEVESFLVPGRTESRSVIEIDELFELVGSLDRRFEDDGVMLDVHERRLHLRATQEHIDDTKALLAALRDHLACEVRIDAVVIRHDGKLLPPAIVQPGQARALFEGHEAEWSGTASTPAGMTSYLGRHTATPYLHTYRAQISEGRQLAEARYDRAFDGVGLLVVPHRLIDNDDLVLQVQFAVGRLEAVHEHQTGLDEQGDLQRPIVDTTAGSMSGRIPNGGALVFNATAPAELGGNVAIVVRASYRQPTTALPEGLRVLPVSALTAHGGSWPRFHDGERLLDNAHTEPGAFDSDGESGHYDPDVLREMLQANVTPDAWDDAAFLHDLRANMLLIGEGAPQTGAIAFLKKIERTTLHNAELRLDLGQGHVTLPTMLDRGHAVRHGRETTAVRGVNGEVAKNSSILVPVVARVFDGAAFAARPYDAGQQLGAELTWQVRRSTAAPRARALPPQQQASRDHHGTIPEQGLETGTGALGAERWTLRRR